MVKMVLFLRIIYHDFVIFCMLKQVQLSTQWYFKWFMDLKICKHPKTPSTSEEPCFEGDVTCCNNSPVNSGEIFPSLDDYEDGDAQLIKTRTGGEANQPTNPDDYDDYTVWQTEVRGAFDTDDSDYTEEDYDTDSNNLVTKYPL